MRASHTVGYLIACSLVLVVAGTTALAAEEWIIETVAAAEGHVSLLLSAGGVLRACFQLVDPCCSPGYCFRDALGWSGVETVDSDNLGGDYAELGLDAAGRPVVAYQKDGHLWVAVRTDEGWAPELVDDREGAGKHLDMAIDSVSGRCHVAYSMGGYGLYHAVSDGSSWALEELRTVDQASYECGICLDSGGYPHVSYYAADIGALGYGFLDGLGWQFETVDGPKALLGLRSTIELDGADQPHIAYRDHNFSGPLKYATKSAGSWIIEIVDDTGSSVHCLSRA